MNTEFRRIHLLHAALQVKGAGVLEIEELKRQVEKLGGSQFDEWNKPLDPQGMKLLTCVLSEGGAAYADVALQTFLERLTSHFHISSDEIRRAIAARLGGLN